MTWRQWNGQFRDDVRGFVKGDAGLVGGADAAALRQRRPVPRRRRTTLPALPERQLRHRPRRLLPLRPGHLQRASTTRPTATATPTARRTTSAGTAAGRATRTSPPEVLALRQRQMKNFCCAADAGQRHADVRAPATSSCNTQRGNNNPYNQDNETTWLDWDRLDSHRDMFRFFKAMIALRKARRGDRPQPVLARGRALVRRDRRAGHSRPGRTAWPGTCPARATARATCT